MSASLNQTVTIKGMSMFMLNEILKLQLMCMILERADSLLKNITVKICYLS